MSERITQELRKAMNVEREYAMDGDVVVRMYCMGRDEFANLCDNIDAVHANLERENESLRRELDRVLGESDGDDWVKLMDARDMGVSAVLKEPEGFGLVALPKDADGEYIHIGDVMEWVDIDGEVEVVCTVDAVGVGCFFAWDAANCRYAQKCANAYRHHHAPTVEDVLREFVDALDIDRCEDFNATIADFAAKLQLRGDAE